MSSCPRCKVCPTCKKRKCNCGYTGKIIRDWKWCCNRLKVTTLSKKGLEVEKLIVDGVRRDQVVIDLEDPKVKEERVKQQEKKVEEKELSPTGSCVYESTTSWSRCIYCGKPYWRNKSFICGVRD